jgi:hypothetical protein
MSDELNTFTLPKGTVLIGEGWHGFATFRLLEDTIGYAPELAAHGGVEGYEKWWAETTAHYASPTHRNSNPCPDCPAES